MIELNAGKMCAEFAPAFGGAVLSLRYDGRDILRPATSLDAVATDPREAACYPCVPWFSRLPGGLDFDGRHYDLAPTLPICDPDHALHGHGWVSAWNVDAQTTNQMQCHFDHAPAPGAFPFSFSAHQRFLLTEDEFSIVLTVTNTSTGPMPVGLGLHPFFPCDKETKLNVKERFEKQNLPGGLRSPELIDHSGPIPDEAIDYTIRGWDGRAEIVHHGMKISLRSSASILHLYSPEIADFYCVEPVTHAPGQFGKDVLAPAESAHLELKLSVS